MVWGGNTDQELKASNGSAGVRFASATVGTSIGSTSTLAAAAPSRVTASAILSAASPSAVGAAKIKTTPIKHKPMAAAAGSADGSTKRAPTDSPRAAPPNNDTHKTIDFHIYDVLRALIIPSDVPPLRARSSDFTRVTTFTNRQLEGLRFPRRR
jgi:hypothetical protein